MGIRITGGTAKGRVLPTGRGAHLRPTSELVRGALFSSLGTLVQRARVLDLYAGTGALGMEALSRGALWADFVEAHPRQAAALKRTLQELGFAERARVYCTRVERAIHFLQGPYDLVFMDPPYDLPSLDPVLERIAASSLLAQGGLLVLEHSRHQPVLPAYGRLHLLRQRRYGDTCIAIYQGGGGG